MRLSEAQDLVSDPSLQIKLGCGEIQMSNTALEELLEYTNLTTSLNPDLNERDFFVSLLKNIIEEKK